LAFFRFAFFVPCFAAFGAELATGGADSIGGLPPAWNSLPGDSSTGAPLNPP